MRLFTTAGTCFALLGLTACGVPTAVTIASYAVDGASFWSTGRSVTDHGISILLQEDCALFRVVRGEAVCQPMKEDDFVYAIAFADRTYDYPKPFSNEGISPPVLAGEPTVELALVPKAEADVDQSPSPMSMDDDRPARERIPLATMAAPKLVAAATPRAATAPPDDEPNWQKIVVPTPRPDAVAMASVLPPPRPSQLTAPQPTLPPGYRVVAGAFNRLQGAQQRQARVQSQLRDLGYSDVKVEIARLPKGGTATYVVVTRPLMPQRATNLLGQLKLDEGENPWKVRSGQYVL